MHADDFTRVRVCSAKCAFNVLALLLGVRRIPVLPDPPPADFSRERADEILGAITQRGHPLSLRMSR